MYHFQQRSTVKLRRIFLLKPPSSQSTTTAIATATVIRMIRDDTIVSHSGLWCGRRNIATTSSSSACIRLDDIQKSIRRVQQEQQQQHGPTRTTTSKYRYIESRLLSSSNSFSSSTFDDSSSENDHEDRMSVTGLVYSSKRNDAPRITLFTKDGCTLCDKVKDVLKQLQQQQDNDINTDDDGSDVYDHSLYQIDITDPDHNNWYDKYKYDIPVLHINDIYWCKHRLSIDEAKEALQESNNGTFNERNGEPDASRLERRGKQT